MEYKIDIIDSIGLLQGATTDKDFWKNPVYKELEDEDEI